MLALLLGPVSVVLSADVAPVVAPLNNQNAIRGCSWRAWISTPSSSPEMPSFILIADRDDSRAIMNIDGSDVVLKVDGKSGPLPSIGDVIERGYNAPGIEVNAIYTVTSDCSKPSMSTAEG